MTNTRYLVTAFGALTAISVLFTLPGGVARAVRDKNPTPEELVERSIQSYYGSRAGLYGTQRNGSMRALVKFFAPDGSAREGKTVTKFIRKQKLAEDLLMIELELSGTRYTIGFDGKEIWTIYNGEILKPAADAVRAFRSGHEHGYEALLRYKENDAKLEYVGTNKLGTLEMDTVDMILPDGSRTRYEISRRTARILYANYEERSNPEAEPVKYRLYYKDFQLIQNTWVPYTVQVFRDGTMIEERKLVESVFNIQLDEKAFLVENALKPAETAIKP